MVHSKIDDNLKKKNPTYFVIKCYVWNKNWPFHIIILNEWAAETFNTDDISGRSNLTKFPWKNPAMVLVITIIYFSQSLEKYIAK